MSELRLIISRIRDVSQMDVKFNRLKSGSRRSRHECLKYNLVSAAAQFTSSKVREVLGSCFGWNTDYRKVFRGFR
jgi:hypothetical protein